MPSEPSFRSIRGRVSPALLVRRREASGLSGELTPLGGSVAPDRRSVDDDEIDARSLHLRRFVGGTIGTAVRSDNADVGRRRGLQPPSNTQPVNISRVSPGVPSYDLVTLGKHQLPEFTGHGGCYPIRRAANSADRGGSSITDPGTPRSRTSSERSQVDPDSALTASLYRHAPYVIGARICRSAGAILAGLTGVSVRVARSGWRRRDGGSGRLGP